MWCCGYMAHRTLHYPGKDSKRKSVIKAIQDRAIVVQDMQKKKKFEKACFPARNKKKKTGICINVSLALCLSEWGWGPGWIPEDNTSIWHSRYGNRDVRLETTTLLFGMAGEHRLFQTAHSCIFIGCHIFKEGIIIETLWGHFIGLRGNRRKKNEMRKQQYSQ